MLLLLSITERCSLHGMSITERRPLHGMSITERCPLLHGMSIKRGFTVFPLHHSTSPYIVFPLHYSTSSRSVQIQIKQGQVFKTSQFKLICFPQFILSSVCPSGSICTESRCAQTYNLVVSICPGMQSSSVNILIMEIL